MQTSVNHLSYKKVTALVLVLALAIFSIGCESGGNSTVVGTLVGAGLGAVIGHQSDHAVEGAIIGAIIGGGIGYYVGTQRSQRVASSSETNEVYAYRSIQGVQIELKDPTVSPGVAAPGEDVNLNTTIAVMAPSPEDTVTIKQRFAIYKGNELVGNIVEDEFTLSPGTHRLSRSITLKKGFPPGRYTYVTNVKAFSGKDMAEDDIEATFTVS
ncbi:MAG: glycine zipper 2TM domain-containing protein [Candidatus Lindowbacteria bacterium]|nr:glycine zipper 2TM domain-containing protein [Candidatus Lindowbacteria bacterium]